VWDAVFPLLNTFARIPVCGLIAQYSATELKEARYSAPQVFRAILTKRLTIRGFIVTDFAAKHGDFQRDVSQWVKEGRIKYREDIAEGLENAPQAFMGMLKGRNFGKQLVRIAE
jgi:NADPH-dependent curcumin reductase CurA